MKRLTYKELFWLLILVLIIYTGFTFLMSLLAPDHFIASNSDSINALFSGLAFAALIFTIMQQREDLDVQHQQLKESIKEQKAATEEFKKQNENIELQRFENTFFKLIENQSSMYLSLSSRISDRVYQKSELINFLNTRFLNYSSTQFEDIKKFLDNKKQYIIPLNLIIGNYHSFPSQDIMYMMDMYLRTISSSFYFLIKYKDRLGDRFIDFLTYFKLQFTDDIIIYIVLHQVFRRKPNIEFVEFLAHFNINQIFDAENDVSHEVILRLLELQNDKEN